MTAFVPPFQRYPYEVWLTTHAFHPGPWTFSEQETRSLASALGRLIRLYDRLFDQPFPYIMLLYAAPKGEEQHFQFHIQFLPFLRTADKLKYCCGLRNRGRNIFVRHVAGETAARLRSIEAVEEPV